MLVEIADSSCPPANDVLTSSLSTDTPATPRVPLERATPTVHRSCSWLGRAVVEPIEPRLRSRVARPPPTGQSPAPELPFGASIAGKPRTVAVGSDGGYDRAHSSPGPMAIGRDSGRRLGERNELAVMAWPRGSWSVQSSSSVKVYGCKGRVPLVRLARAHENQVGRSMRLAMGLDPTSWAPDGWAWQHATSPRPVGRDAGERRFPTSRTGSSTLATRAGGGCAATIRVSPGSWLSRPRALPPRRAAVEPLVRRANRGATGPSI